MGSKKLSFRHWSDERLAARLDEGDVGALEVLYDRHAALILGMALKVTGSRPLAEKVLQETFWQAWQRAGTYRFEHGTFTAWLFRMARSLAIDASQRQR